MVFERDTFELIRRAPLGLALFVLLITALTIKGQAQQTGPSIKERANTASANTLWYNSTLGVNMLAGRFLMIIPTLAGDEEGLLIKIQHRHSRRRQLSA